MVRWFLEYTVFVRNKHLWKEDENFEAKSEVELGFVPDKNSVIWQGVLERNF